MSMVTKLVLWLLGGAVRVAGLIDEQLLWSRLSIGGDVPQPRENIAAAVFADREQFYIYGGYTFDAQRLWLQDLWRFNLNGMTWEAIEAGGGDGPGTREDYFCATFEARDRFYLFGGSGEGGPKNDLWSFDVNSSNWTEVVAGNDAPSPRKDGVTAAFADKGVFFVYGGFGTAGRPIDELWHFSLDSSMWSQVIFTVSDTTGFPQGRQNHGVAVFADAGFFLVYAGRGFAGVYFDDIWRFDVDAGDSKQVVAKQAAVADVNMRPAARYYMGIATFEAGRYFVMYGGFNGERLGDTWRFDVDTDKWEELIVGDSAPPARFGFTVATFEADEVFYLYGGFSEGHLAEMWMLGNGTTTTTTLSSTTTTTTTETNTTIMTSTTVVTRVTTVATTAAPTEAGLDWGTVAVVVVLLIAFAGGGFFLGSRTQVREASTLRQADSSEVELMEGTAPAPNILVGREHSVEV